MKTCIKCNQEKELSEFYTNGNRCKKCILEYNREYNIKNKEKVIKYHREYNIKNREDISNYNKDYYIKNVDKIKEQRKTCPKQDRREYYKEYALKNKLK